MKDVPLLDFYSEIGAEIGEFAGWRSPLWFKSAREEHLSVRKSVGVFDITHMTRIQIYGEDSEKFLQRLVTKNVQKIKPGRMKYCLICNERGGIIDDITVYRRKDGRGFYIVSNALTHDKVLDKMMKMAEEYEDAVVEDLTYKTGLFAVQGPMSAELVSDFTELDVSGMKWFSGAEFEHLGLKVLLTRSGYTGENGYEFLVWSWESEELKRFWEELIGRGATACGLAARDSLRLEAGYPLYGQDMDEDTTPVEARLDFAVDLSKEDFLGKTALERVWDKPRKILVGLQLTESGVPRRGYKIIDSEGEYVGEVTSGGLSYTLKRGIALGYVKPEIASTGEELKILIHGKPRRAEIKLTPFVPHRMK